MAKVYGLSAGSYSDYSIVGVFSSAEKREAFKKEFPITWDSYCDEDWTLDEGITEIEAGLSPYDVTMDKELNVKRVTKRDSPADRSVRVYDYPQTGPLAHGQLWARDEAHAIKIMSDRVAQLVATDRFVRGESSRE